MTTRDGKEAGDGRSVVLFDGVCNLCNAAVDFIIGRDQTGRFRFAALQSGAGRALLDRYGLRGEDRDTVVLIQDGRAYTRSEAVLRIARGLSGGWPALYLFKAVPRPLRDAVYRFISAERYRWFGQRDVCRAPTPDLRARFLE